MANVKNIELDWVKIREDLDSTYVTETILEKAKRKTRENPLVPIGKLTYNYYWQEKTDLSDLYNSLELYETTRI